jgi:hypothetical protein
MWREGSESIEDGTAKRCRVWSQNFDARCTRHVRVMYAHGICAGQGGQGMGAWFAPNGRRDWIYSMVFRGVDWLAARVAGQLEGTSRVLPTCVCRTHRLL